MHPSAASRRHRDDEDDEEDEDEEEDPPSRLNDAEYADGEGDPCPNCGREFKWVRVVWEPRVVAWLVCSCPELLCGAELQWHGPVALHDMAAT